MRQLVKFKQHVINRNPRNLEMTGLAYKPLGWALQHPPKDFYNRIQFRSSERHTYAEILNFSGKIVVSASTKEHCIRRHICSTKDTYIAKLLGKIIVDRAIMSGFDSASIIDNYQTSDSSRLKSFYDGVHECARLKKEPEFISGPYFNHGVDYDKVIKNKMTPSNKLNFTVYPDSTDKTIEQKEAEFIWRRIQHHWKNVSTEKFSKADEETN
ncbi:hypothetical protein GJ496_005324 [Pomphorhynchus laevis]|nr:hypothetical protein GJ496_005324 [Pomphorhynchus laevis]